MTVLMMMVPVFVFVSVPVFVFVFLAVGVWNLVGGFVVLDFAFGNLFPTFGFGLRIGVFGLCFVFCIGYQFG
jgi:hypothetical protein